MKIIFFLFLADSGLLSMPVEDMILALLVHLQIVNWQIKKP